jgi:hypothetical protein
MRKEFCSNRWTKKDKNERYESGERLGINLPFLVGKIFSLVPAYIVS